MKPIAIDLGLSARWADRNLGAEDIYIPGTLFTPNERSRSMAHEIGLLNYCIKEKLGGKWRLPTILEVQELMKASTIWPARYRRLKDPMDENKGYNFYDIYKLKGKNGRYCYFNQGYHLFEGVDPESSIDDDNAGIPGIWNLNDYDLYYPYYHEKRSCPSNFQHEEWYGKDYIPYAYYYKYGLPIRPVTDDMPSRGDKFLRFFEYNTWDGDDRDIEVYKDKQISYFDYNKYYCIREEVPDEEKRERYFARCEEQNRQKERQEREEREIEERKRESQHSVERSSFSSSDSQYDDYCQNRERERREEDEREKQERLEDWYRDYVTIDVDLEYFCRGNEYNQEDYWDYRNHEIRVTRREAMALIEAGKSAIISKLGYSQSLTRIIRFQIPYGLYDRPWGC